MTINSKVSEHRTTCPITEFGVSEFFEAGGELFIIVSDEVDQLGMIRVYNLSRGYEQLFDYEAEVSEVKITRIDFENI